MQSLSVAGLTTAFLLLSDCVDAINIGVTGRRTGRHHYRRADNSTGESGLDDATDLHYYTNITMGGQAYQVLIDTGSSDLWVAGSVPGAKATGHMAGVVYASGSAQGPIKKVPVTFAGYTVPEQAFIEVVPDETNPEGLGLIGLGPGRGSSIFVQINDASAAPVLDRIFSQNTSTPNYLTVLLGRYDDPTDTFSGNITVGELLDGYTDIKKRPKIPVTTTQDSSNQHFQVLMDEDGFIGPDGKAIHVTTEVKQTKNKKRLTSVFDSGFSLPQVPSSVAQAIYGGFKGAELVNVSEVGVIWTLPCNIEVNLTVKLGGKSYPIHPLDTTVDPSRLGLNISNAAGDPICGGTFQPMSFDRGDSISYDVILGMAFLRNVYMLFDFGDFVVGGANKRDPYMKFLSTTDPKEAHSDFVTVRLGGIDTTGDHSVISAGLDVSESEDDDDKDKSNHTTLYILISVAGGVFVLMAIGAFFLARARKNRKSKIASADVRYQKLGHPEGMAGVSGPPVSNSAYTDMAYNPNQAYDHPYDSTSYPFSSGNTQFSNTQ